MLELLALTKRFGERVAVDDLTVTIRSGQVTALLGPNGAGKSTVMRVLLGLEHPSAGTALVDGFRYVDLTHPMRSVGAHLDARAFHPRRSGRANLLALARYSGIPRQRVDDVLVEVGLSTVAGKRAGTYSLGMAQRLGIAAALLGDPATVILDEPVNGLDADGVRWVRSMTRRWASEGRTVLISSHLMSEVAVTADHVVILGRGRLLADVSLAELTARHDPFVEVSAADNRSLAAALVGDGTRVESTSECLRVYGIEAAEVGRRAYDAGVVLRELHTNRASLEDAYMELVSGETEYTVDIDVPVAVTA
jgi:ABC-2 type transport system ATP-binding protein